MNMKSILTSIATLWLTPMAALHAVESPAPNAKPNIILNEITRGWGPRDAWHSLCRFPYSGKENHVTQQH